MKIFKVCLILFLAPYLAHAQYNCPVHGSKINKQILAQKQSSASFEQVQIPIAAIENREQQAISFLMQRIPELQNPENGLQLSHLRVSRIGYHYSFKQTYKGLPVFGATIQFNTNFQGTVLSTFNHCMNTENWKQDAFVSQKSKGNACWIVLCCEPIAGYSKFEGDHQLLVDLNGNELIRKEAKYNYMQDDTTATGKVFLPDPLSSQSVIYGQDGTYQHFNDSDYAGLNDQRKLVTFSVTYEQDSFKLKNKNVIIVDRESPFIHPVASKTPSFDFLRSRSGFKDLMVLYHVTATQSYFQYLGFDELENYQIKADAHSSTIDQSFFAFGADSSINFGTGGVPDAEDADVIIHEYTHALSWFINPSPNMSIERRAIEEGICDVISAVQSKKYTDFNWRRIFNFDGPNPVAAGVSGFWNGRNGNSPKKYSDRRNNSYLDCEIWTSTILDITNEIGADSAAILMLESVYSMSDSTTMPEAAALFMQADSILFNKYFSWKIGRLFNERELGSFKTSVKDINELKQYVVLKNTAAFAAGEGDAVMDISMFDNVKAILYDAKGALIKTIPALNNEIRISPSALNSGIYFLKLIDGDVVYNCKLIR